MFPTFSKISTIQSPALFLHGKTYIPITASTETKALKQNFPVNFLWNSEYSPFLSFFNFISYSPYGFDIFRFIQRILQFFPQVADMYRNRII